MEKTQCFELFWQTTHLHYFNFSRTWCSSVNQKIHSVNVKDYARYCIWYYIVFNKGLCIMQPLMPFKQTILSKWSYWFHKQCKNFYLCCLFTGTFVFHAARLIRTCPVTWVAAVYRDRIGAGASTRCCPLSAGDVTGTPRAPSWPRTVDCFMWKWTNHIQTTWYSENVRHQHIFILLCNRKKLLYNDDLRVFFFLNGT